MSKYNYILFDLDGTLTDSGEGIINSVVHALEKRDIAVPDRAALRVFVGPPLLDSFAQYYGMDREEGMKAIADYREYFTDRGWKENSVYPGIPQVLEQLKMPGHICTLRPPSRSRLQRRSLNTLTSQNILMESWAVHLTKRSQKRVR